MRSVAYSSGGVAIVDNVGGSGFLAPATSKGDVPVPAFIPTNNYAAGKITTEVNLKTRPYSVTGFYKFIPYGSDKGSVVVEVYNGTTVIGRGSVIFTDRVTDWMSFEATINYSSAEKATRMVITCSSSAGDPTIIQLGFDKNRCTALGNELSIDEINLNY